MTPDYRHHTTPANRWPQPTYTPAKRKQPERLPWRGRCRATASGQVAERRGLEPLQHRTHAAEYNESDGVARRGTNGEPAREESERRATRSRAPRARRAAGQARDREHSHPAQPSPASSSGPGVGPKKAVAGIPAGHLSNFIVMYKLGSIAAKLIYIVGYRKYIDGQV